MKSRAVPLFLMVLLGGFWLLPLQAMHCPVCFEDSFDGENCTNPQCGINQPHQAGMVVNLPRSEKCGEDLIPPVAMAAAKAGLNQACFVPKGTTTGGSSEDDTLAPGWLLNKSREATRPVDGDDEGVPNLTPFWEQAIQDRVRYRPQNIGLTSDDARGALIRSLQRRDSAFMVHYQSRDSAEDEEWGVDHIFLIAVTVSGTIYVLSNVRQMFNEVSETDADTIEAMIDFDSFYDDSDQIRIYRYLGPISEFDDIQEEEN